MLCFTSKLLVLIATDAPAVELLFPTVARCPSWTPWNGRCLRGARNYNTMCKFQDGAPVVLAKLAVCNAAFSAAVPLSPPTGHGVLSKATTFISLLSLPQRCPRKAASGYQFKRSSGTTGARTSG